MIFVDNSSSRKPSRHKAFLEPQFGCFSFITEKSNISAMSALMEVANSSSILNITRKPGDMKLDRAISYTVLGFLSVFSNAVLCLVFVRNRQMLRRAYNIIIFSLRIIDILTGKLNNTCIYYFTFLINLC